MSSILTDLQIIWSTLLTTGQSNKTAASPPHVDGSVVFASWRQCAPIYKTCMGPHHSSSQTASRSVKPFLHCCRQRVPILYSGPPLSPIKIAPSHGISGLHLIHSFLGLPESTTQTASRSVFAGLTIVTDRPTDKPHYSVCNNRPHLRTK